MEVDGLGSINITNTTTTVIYSESLYGLSVIEMNLESTEQELWQKFMTDKQGRGAKIRWIPLPQQTPTPWKYFWFEDITANFGSDYVTVYAKGVCSGISLQYAHPQRTYADERISNIVKEIASDHGMVADVGPSSENKFDFTQGDKSDYEFLIELSKSAVSINGVSDYRFYVRDGRTLVFRPVSNQDKDVIATFSTTYASDPTIVVGEIPVRFNRRSMNGAGERIRMAGYNKLTGKPVFHDATSKNSSITRFASNTPAIPSSVYRLIENPKPSFGKSSPGDLAEVGQGAWGWGANRLYTATIKCPFLPDAQVGKVVNIISKNLDNKKSPFSGNWSVSEVRHELRPNTLLTFIQCERRGWN